MNARQFFSGFSTARPLESSTIDPGVLKASAGTLLVLRDNLASALNDSRRADFHGDYRTQLSQIDAELSRRVERTETLADLDLCDHNDGRAEVTAPERKRDSLFAAQLSRIAGVLVCAVALAAMSGCVNTSLDGPGAMEFTSVPARNRQVLLTGLMAVDTAQTVTIARSPCLYEANPVASAVFGSKQPSPQTVLITNTIYIASHWALGSYLDRKAERPIDMSIPVEQDMARRGRWQFMRGLYQFASFFGHGFAVASNTRKGINPFSSFGCQS